MSQNYEGIRDAGDTVAKSDKLPSMASNEYSLGADSADEAEVTRESDDDGLEVEREEPVSDDHSDITEPFNPEKIKVRTNYVLIEQLGETH